MLCLCADIEPLDNRIPVVVVMHPREAPKTSNSGRLAVRMLRQAELRICDRERSDVPRARRLVLFPCAEARPLRPDDAQPGTLLVVPDGSWRQAKRIARRDRWARGGELVQLCGGAESRYGLRRGSREDALSTFEAIARALALLEGPELEERLMPLFELFVTRMLSLRSSSSSSALTPR
jgi:DTW domain-containing protein YfiP